VLDNNPSVCCILHTHNIYIIALSSPQVSWRLSSLFFFYRYMWIVYYTASARASVYNIYKYIDNTCSLSLSLSLVSCRSGRRKLARCGRFFFFKQRIEK
jgi:hypothetical protein